jgi:hypothetical protein
MAVELSNKQIWTVIAMGFMILAFLIYNIWSGTQDRAIIKENINSILGNISQTEIKQNQTLSQLRSNGIVLGDTIEMIDNNTASNRNMTMTNREMITDLADRFDIRYQNASILLHQEQSNEIQEIKNILMRIANRSSLFP